MALWAVPEIVSATASMSCSSPNKEVNFFVASLILLQDLSSLRVLPMTFWIRWS